MEEEEKGEQEKGEEGGDSGRGRGALVLRKRAGPHTSWTMMLESTTVGFRLIETTEITQPACF